MKGASFFPFLMLMIIVVIIYQVGKKLFEIEYEAGTNNTNLPSEISNQMTIKPSDALAKTVEIETGDSITGKNTLTDVVLGPTSNDFSCSIYATA